MIDCSQDLAQAAVHCWSLAIIMLSSTRPASAERKHVSNWRAIIKENSAVAV
jgi:hypothetical protein